MNQQGFEDYTHFVYGHTTGTANRMNPENGLCLSGTYDLAFDQHLISFDEDYRMIVGSEIGGHYTNTVTRDYFKKFSGKKIAMPSKFLPSQIFLQAHRELLR